MFFMYPDTLTGSTIGRRQKLARSLSPERSTAILCLVLTAAVSARMGLCLSCCVVQGSRSWSAGCSVGAKAYIFAVYVSEILLKPKLRFVSSVEHLPSVYAQLAV